MEAILVAVVSIAALGLLTYLAARAHQNAATDALIDQIAVEEEARAERESRARAENIAELQRLERKYAGDVDFYSSEIRRFGVCAICGSRLNTKGGCRNH